MTIESQPNSTSVLHQPGTHSNVIDMVAAYHGDLPMQIHQTRVNLGQLTLKQQAIDIEIGANESQQDPQIYLMHRAWLETKSAVVSARRLSNRIRLAHLAWLEGVENPGPIDRTPAVATPLRAR